MLITLIATAAAALLAVFGLLRWSFKADQKIAAAQPRIVHEVEVTDVRVPESANNTAVVTGKPLRIAFGSIFWPIVAAWLFCGFVTWLAWKILTF